NDVDLGVARPNGLDRVVTGAVVDDPDRGAAEVGLPKAFEAGQGDLTPVPVEHDDGHVGGPETPAEAQLHGHGQLGEHSAQTLGELHEVVRRRGTHAILVAAAPAGQRSACRWHPRGCRFRAHPGIAWAMPSRWRSTPPDPAPLACAP